MGNKQSQNFQWQNKFIVLQKNFNDNTVVLQRNQGGQQLIGRQIVSTDKKQTQQIKRLVQHKYHKNNPFLTKLVQFYNSIDLGYCSPEQKIYLIFQKPKQTLKQEILARKFANQPFSEEQADIILESGAKAIRSLKQLNHPHNNISASSIFIDDDRKIILGDPWITPPAYIHDINQNVNACPSPQKILLQNDQIMSICPYRSDLFSLGTVVLQALNFQHMDILYEKGFRRLLENKVNQKLMKIKNEHLRFKLSVVLSHDPLSRDQIYRLYRTSGISVPQTRQQIIKNSNVKINQNMAGFYQPKLLNQQNKLNQGIKIQKQIYPMGEQLKLNNNKPIPKINIGGNVIRQKKIEAGFNAGNINKQKNLYQIPEPIHNQTFNKVQNNLNLNNKQTSIGINKNYSTQPVYHPIISNIDNSAAYKLNTYINSNPNSYEQTSTNRYCNFAIPNWNNNQSLLEKRPLATPTISTHTYLNHNIQNNYLNYPTAPAPASNRSRLQNNAAVLTESVYNYNFEPVLLKSNDDFVRNSSDIKYIEGLSKSNGLKSSHENQTDNIQITNYSLKNNQDLIFKITPKESQQITITKEAASEEAKDKSSKKINADQNQGAYQSKEKEQEPQSKVKIEPNRMTPDRKPNRKYNSTIKQQPDECSYSGERQDQQDCDYVIQQYQTGKYEGQKKNGMRNGYGKFMYIDGSVYQGYWKDNLMDGKGCLYYSNGKLAYEGDWRMDQFYGTGKIYNSDQAIMKGGYNYTDFTDINDFWSSYQGQLKSDRKHGKGKVKFPNGQIFSGNFQQDNVEGQGKFYKTNGQIIHGVWNNNKLVKKL